VPSRKERGAARWAAFLEDPGAVSETSISHIFQSDFVRPVLQPVKVLSPEERGAARWAAFLEDPDAWLDQRPAKAAGQLGSRHPDFVHSADKRRSLWLDSHTTPPEVHKVRRPMPADCE